MRSFTLSHNPAQRHSPSEYALKISRVPIVAADPVMSSPVVSTPASEPAPSPVMAAAAPTAPPANNLVGELERLADLKERGLLTEKEYSDAKAQLVAQNKV